ncbi:MAG: protein translocase subunit SecF [Gammaproteobacteria bacterium]
MKTNPQTTTQFNFMSRRKLAAALSVLLLLVSIGSLVTRGLEFGIDFTGGTLVEVGYGDAIDLNTVRTTLANSEFGDAVVQYFGTAQDVLIRLAPREGKNSADISEAIIQLLRQTDASVTVRRVEFVGPQVGEELTNDGGLAMIYALLGIFIYVALRFQRLFSLGAIAALVHDVLIVLGLFSVIQLSFDLTVLAALLAVIGYSLNDTIVVFDRIRENFRRLRTSSSVDVINTSLNQTLSRTLITSATTLLVLGALFYYGGEVIHSFSIALIAGVLIGTYSSIYVASPVTLALGISKQDLMPVDSEGLDKDRGAAV